MGSSRVVAMLPAESGRQPGHCRAQPERGADHEYQDDGAAPRARNAPRLPTQINVMRQRTFN
jgi:hypothetical protein